MATREERLAQLVTLIRESSDRVDRDVFLKQDVTEIGTISRRHLWNAEAVRQGEMRSDI